MKVFRPAVLLLVAATAALAADVVIPDYLPPGTRVVVGLSLRSLVNSSTLKSLGGEARTMSVNMFKDGPLAGMNPLTDIDDLLLASTGEGEKPPTLVVLHGRFDLDRLSKAGTPYNGILVVEDNSKMNGGTMAFLDASTAIAGETAQVKAAIDRRGQPVLLASSLAERVKLLAGHFAFWGVGDLPQGFHAPSAAGSDFDSVDHFEFSASVQSGLQLNGEIHLRSAEAAGKMAQSMKFLEAMVAGKQPSADGSRFNLKSKNGTLKVSIVIPEAELKKGIQAQKKSLSAMIASGMPMPTAARPEPLPSPKPRTHQPSTVVTNDRGDTVTVTLPGGGR